MDQQLAVTYPDLDEIIKGHYESIRPMVKSDQFWTYQPGDVKTKEDLKLFTQVHTQTIYNTAILLKEKLYSLGAERLGVPTTKILRGWFHYHGYY